MSENKKILYSILNWNRDVNPLFGSILSPNNEYIICTNTNKISANNVYNIDADKSIAKSLNMIIDKAIELNTDYLFILEDDIKIKDNSVFQKYIDLMEQFQYGLIFYGFIKGNRIFNKRPNPCVQIKLKNNENIIFNRFISSGCLLIDLKKNKEKFNESLQVLEFEEYIFRCRTLGHIPFNGFYIDLNDSWNYIESIPCKGERNRSLELIKADKLIMDNLTVDNKLEFNVDKLFKHLIDKGF